MMIDDDCWGKYSQYVRRTYCARRTRALNPFKDRTNKNWNNVLVLEDTADTVKVQQKQQIGHKEPKQEKSQHAHFSFA